MRLVDNKKKSYLNQQLYSSVTLNNLQYIWEGGGVNTVQNNSPSLYFGLIIAPNCFHPRVEVSCDIN